MTKDTIESILLEEINTLAEEAGKYKYKVNKANQYLKECRLKEEQLQETIDTVTYKAAMLETVLSTLIDDLEDLTNADNPSTHSLVNNLRHLIKGVRTQYLT